MVHSQSAHPQGTRCPPFLAFSHQKKEQSCVSSVLLTQRNTSCFHLSQSRCRKKVRAVWSSQKVCLLQAHVFQWAEELLGMC